MRSTRTPGVRFLLVAGLIGAAACGDSTGSNPVARVDVTPAQAQLWAGDTLTLAAVARNADGQALDEAITWSSSSAAVATVDGAGKVTAVGPGQATIKAAAGGREAAATLTVATYDLVYESRAAGSPELFILSLAGGPPVRVRPAGSGWGIDPAPSPDGSRIAFVVREVVGGPSEIWVMNRNGTGAVQLTNDPGLDDYPAWSPDGTRIAWRSHAAGRLGDIWVMNADGTGKRQLTFDPLPGVTDDTRPAWSPDGQTIVYASILANDGDLYVIPSGGGTASRLTAGAGHDTEPAWSPDGSRIAFRRSFQGGSDVMVMDADGTDVAGFQLPNFQWMPAWSPDGRLIAFSEGSAPGDVPQLFTIRPDGTQLTRRTSDPAWGGGSDPAFIRRAD